MARTFVCSLVTPERAVFEGEVAYANVPAHDGQLGVLPHRAPLLAQIGSGVLRLQLPDNAVRRYELEGGFIQMNENRLTLLCKRATELTGSSSESKSSAA